MIAVSGSDLWVYGLGHLLSHGTSKPADICDHTPLSPAVPLCESPALTASPPLPHITDDSDIPPAVVLPTSQLTVASPKLASEHTSMSIATVGGCRYCYPDTHSDSAVTGHCMIS